MINADEVNIAEPMEAPAINPVHDVLTVCGITNEVSRNVFINIEGLDSTIDKFARLNGDHDVSEMAKRLGGRSSVANHKVLVGTIPVKNLQALVYWCKDHHRRGLMLDPANWIEAELWKVSAKKTAEENAEKIGIDLIDPGKCQTDHGWDNWQIAFVNKLSAKNGVAGIPVNYIVQPDLEDADELFLKDEEVHLYQIPLKGPAYKHDNKLVYSMLKAACVETDAWASWIQGHDRTYDGRKAWLALVEHYDGTAELNRCVSRARLEIDKLH